MKNYISYIALAFFVVGISLSSCERGNTIGSLSNEVTDGFIEFDSFSPPKEGYYFYALFDGSYRLWQHGLRSKWDTNTRLPATLADQDEPWSTWATYTDNIYTNVCNNGAAERCPEEDFSDFYLNQTRFIRSEIPTERIELNFYRCANFIDTFSTVYFENPVEFMEVGAWPFSDLERLEWGAELIYIDSNRTRWSTRTGSGKPEETYLRITDYYPNPQTDTTDTFGLFVIEGEFEGRLFNPIGEQKVLTNSKFRTRLWAREPEGF